ncbi:MAG: ABC transporter permease subunit [Coprobacillus sp.]
MKSYIAFTSKEILESIRSYKAFILIIVFLILGFMSPITAKLTPEIVKNFMPEGMSIVITEPTVIDSWMQFFKNVPQIGMIVIVIVFSSLVSGEISKGTLINVLTKGLSRQNVILAKFTCATLIWTICYYVAFLVVYFYNLLFWTDTGVYNLFFSVSCVWIFGIFLISTLLLGGVLFKSSYGSLLLTGGLVVIMMFIGMLQTIAKFNPMQLMSVNMSLLTGPTTPSDLYISIIVTVSLTLLSLISSIIIFNKKQI